VSANNFYNSVTPQCGKGLPVTRKVISLATLYSYCISQHLLTNITVIIIFKRHALTKFLVLIVCPSTMISLFQKSGLPLDVTVRFQINMVVGDLNGISRAAKFSNMVLPMLWTEFVSIFLQQPCFIIKFLIGCDVPCPKLCLLVKIQNLRTVTCWSHVCMCYEASTL
jgi:hypothetical protein